MHTVKKNLVVISPNTPPQICGVGDYAYRLSKEFYKNKIYTEVTIATDNMNNITENSGKFDIKHWSKILPQILAHRETSYDILINYTPKGFSKIGYPISFIRFLKGLTKLESDIKIFILFHETWNGDTSNFRIHHKVINWFSKKGCFELIDLCFKVGVVTLDQKNTFEKEGVKRRVELLPVGSNIIPASEAEVFNSERNFSVWVVFGMSHTRLWALEKNKDLIQWLESSGYIQELITIGPKDDSSGKQELDFLKGILPQYKIKQLGKLEPEIISKELLIAGAAFVGQNSDEGLLKSGSFLALAAHGVAIVYDYSQNLKNPPKEGIFKKYDIMNSSNVVDYLSKNKKQKHLYDWFIKNKSWGSISRVILNWMNKF